MEDFNTIDNEATIQDDFDLRKLTSGLTLCGKYRLEKEAGAGGMSVVWKAWDIVGERWIALKFVPPEIRHSDIAIDQLKTAFQTIQALNHQNIGPVYALEKDPVFGCFIVKKWLEGQPLSELKLPQEEIPTILTKVADALDYAHSKRVMHRDVKPSNIFIETDGDVSLIDFGIAAQIQNSISQNDSSTDSRTSGTRPYMAPEQWQGQHQDGQTDQYALGVVAYQLFAGHLPFQNTDPALLRMAVLQDPPEPLDKVPPAVNSAILRALSKDRMDRFTTCREFVDSLTGTFKGTKPGVPIPSNSPKTPSSVEAVKAAEEENLRENLLRLGRQIRDAYQAGLYAKAIAHIKELLRLQPQNLNAKWLLEQVNKKLTTTGAKHPSKLKQIWNRFVFRLRQVLYPDLMRLAGERIVLKAGGVKYAFRWCPPGEFIMGSPKSEWDKSKITWKNYDEEQHKVKITRGFWLLETEVTQEMWQSVMGKNPSRFKGNKKPVEQVSWHDCQEFCKRLRVKLHRKIKLPTEAQWEYACRAGMPDDCARNLDEMAWYEDNSDSKTHEVGQKMPNAWGLYDMYGNVYEWCTDFYDENYYSKSPTSDPENTKATSFRVARGGSWGYYAENCRPAYRVYDDPGIRYYSLGLRVLMEPGRE